MQTAAKQNKFNFNIYEKENSFLGLVFRIKIPPLRSYQINLILKT
jgi:hypothetical protein